MSDMLVKLYQLPNYQTESSKLKAENIIIRRANAYEKLDIIEWVKQKFDNGWASECDVSFSNAPISCFIATQHGKIMGFACYDSTCKNFFGPTGVDSKMRGKGIGKFLLLACLEAMKNNGYAYAIIGGVGPAEFYHKIVGAVEIEGSTPGIYIDMLDKKKGSSS